MKILKLLIILKQSQFYSNNCIPSRFHKLGDLRDHGRPKFLNRRHEDVELLLNPMLNAHLILDHIIQFFAVILLFLQDLEVFLHLLLHLIQQIFDLFFPAVDHDLLIITIV